MAVRSRKMFVAILILVGLVIGGDCFPTGAPAVACLTWFPKHNMETNWTTSGVSPYRVTFSTPGGYNLGQNITVTIESTDANIPFKGFILSAHRKSQNFDEFQGRWVAGTPAGKWQPLTCVGKNNAQVTHTNPTPVPKVDFTWETPSVAEGNQGTLIFRYTVVESFNKIYAWQEVELPSAVGGIAVTPDPLIEEAANTMADIDFSGCGSTKGCFLYPKDCTGAECEKAVTCKYNDDTYSFEMLATTPGYAVMGLSFDMKMGIDYTVACTQREPGNVVSVYPGFNPSYYPDRFPAHSLTNMAVKRTGDTLQCRFTVPKVLVGGGWIPSLKEVKTYNFDLSSEFYLFLAAGYQATNTDVIGKHTQRPTISDTKLKFPSLSQGTTSSSDWTTQACFMVVMTIAMTHLLLFIV